MDISAEDIARYISKHGLTDKDTNRVVTMIYETWIRHVTVLFNQRLLPTMRRATPYRTGQLRDAMRVWREGNKVILGFSERGFYWIWQRGLPGTYERIYKRLVPEITKLAYYRTRRDIGI